MLNNESEKQINECLSLLKNILGQNLLGVYLHGSAIVGGLQKYSDIDLFIISDRATTHEEKATLSKHLLKISGIYMKSSKLSIEMTIVVKSAVNPWRYPPHFDFQYGDWLREKFASGVIEPWSTYEMPDLALLITQVLLASQTLFGLSPEQLLDRVPYQDFIQAISVTTTNLIANINDDMRNVLLTYARIWNTLETNTIRSKQSAADWTINRLPEVYKPVMRRARAISIGEAKEYWKDLQGGVKPCAEFMLHQINRQISLLDLSDNINKSIKLAE
jgi:predicted nucleotidyltransferase